MTSAARLRQLLAEGELLTAPTAFDPLSALLAERAGFPLCYIGGYVVGAHLGCGEPLLTASEMVEAAGRIANAVRIPTIADAGAGFGGLPHTVRTIREFERAGVAGVHIEDQVVPKRVGYHKGEVHVVPRDEMRHKLRFALEARDSADFVVIARTDARRAVNGGLEEALKRIRMYVELEADLILAFPADAEEAARFAEAAPGRMVYVAPEGRSTRPNLPASELKALGYRMLVHSEGSLLTAASALRDYYRDLRARPDTTSQAERAFAAERVSVENALGLVDLFALEDLEPL